MKRRSAQKRVKRKKIVKELIEWILLCELVGVLGGLLTFPEITGWYQTLVKPSFSPPNWIFGPVWTALYALMGIAAYRISQLGRIRTSVAKFVGLFIFQLIVNFLWSLLFFQQHNIGAAFTDIVLLWLILLFLTVKFDKIDKPAAGLMIPYVFWVSFALVLNYHLWILNPGI